jgi:2,4-dienoyl-CoA reductase-like NADH-dependent reductase (Old Yellow Enzyme family)
MTGQPTSWADSLLFSPLHVGAVRFRNRIVLPPMKTNMDLTDRQALSYYRARAAGGVGLVIVEATPLEQFEDPRFGDALRRLADAVHAGGATAAIQLIQFGRLNGERVEPSATEDARAVTTEEIKEIVGRFAAAAAMACDAGFDAAEIHGAHDFLLNRFFSPQLNRRTDEYGGTLDRRMRFGIETVGAVRRECGEGFLVLYRHTTMLGCPIEDDVAFAKAIEKAGVNIVDISPSTSGPDAKHADLAATVKAGLRAPVIAVGGMEDPIAAEEVLREQRADLVAIGRALIADPDLPRKILEGRFEEIIECVKCNELCFGNLEKGIPIGCTRNPETGMEYQRW